MSTATMIQRARVRLVTTEPFYATLLLNMHVVETETMPDGQPLWMAATNGETLWLNPVNVNALTLPEAVGLLKHEVLHVAFLHPWRMNNRNHSKWNKATDDIINDIITIEGGSLPEGGRMFPDISRTHTAEQRYVELADEPEGDGGSGGEDPFDGDLLPAPKNGGESPAVSEARAKAMVAQAVAVAKAQGKMPGGLKEYMDELFESVLPWTEVLTRFLTDVSQNDYTWARPNRRFVAQGLYLPGIASMDSMGKLGVIIDTSGSMGAEELRRSFGEVVGAVQAVCPSQLVVVYCDAEVNHVDHLDEPTEDDVREVAARHGGGGTDMTVAQRWFEENEPDTKAILVFTDGYTPFSESSIPTLWCIDTDVVSPHGETVRVRNDG